MKVGDKSRTLSYEIELPIHTVNVRNPNTFGFQTQGVRSVPICFEQVKRLKSERKRSDFTLFSVRNPNDQLFERSDFRQLTKLGRFIYKDSHKKEIVLYKTV